MNVAELLGCDPLRGRDLRAVDARRGRAAGRFVALPERTASSMARCIISTSDGFPMRYLSRARTSVWLNATCGRDSALDGPVGVKSGPYRSKLAPHEAASARLRHTVRSLEGVLRNTVWVGVMFWVGFACGVGAFLVSAVLMTILSDRMRRNSSRNEAARTNPAGSWPIADSYNTRTFSAYHASNENTPPRYGRHTQ